MAIGEKYAIQNLARHNTRAARKMELLLKELRVPYVRESPVIVKPKSGDGRWRLYILDFFLPEPINIAIEVDGGYHRKLSQKEKDILRDEAVEASGISKTFRFTNEQILADNFSMLTEILYTKSIRGKFSKFWQESGLETRTLPKKKKAGKKQSFWDKSTDSYMRKGDFYRKKKKNKKVK